MNFTYKTTGTCSSRISFDINNGVVSNVKFTGGCNGNLKGISSLVDGMKGEDIVKKVKGLKCGFKNTSCPDQLALAIEQAMKEEIKQ